MLASNRLGISTCWNAVRLREGAKIIEEITSLGFSRIEIEYRLSEDAIPDFEHAVRNGSIVVSSVHNFAPLPSGEEPTNSGADRFSLASTDQSEREQAVRQTLTTFELARRLGARAVILHLGHVEVRTNYLAELIQTVKEKGRTSPEAERVRRAFREERHKYCEENLRCAIQSVKDLLSQVEEWGIKICIENRYYFHQIPLVEEMVRIKEEVSHPLVCYWHDVGHAHVQEVLGLGSHRLWLDRVGHCMAGIHIHDATFIYDHKAPGNGEIDFEVIFNRIPPDCIKVLELSSQVSRDEVISGINFLRRFGLTP